MTIAAFVCVVGLLFAPAMILAQNSNAPSTDPVSMPEAPLGCWVSMLPGGTPVSYVPESADIANSTFWLNYAFSGSTSRLKFLVKFQNGSPLTKHIQKFENVTGFQSTPFAYPSSSDNSIMGPALFKVTADTERCTYPFVAGGKNFESSWTPGIPDSSGTMCLVNVSGVGTITKLVVTISIEHARDSDLVIQLFGPDFEHGDYTYALLALFRGGDGDNYGHTAYQRTVFDDDAALSIADGSAPFIGIYRPEPAHPLSVFNGMSGTSANGTWYININDVVSGVVGHVESCSIIVFD